MARSGRVLRSARRSEPAAPYCPDAGDIVWIDFDAQAGREQAARRPALVLSPKKYNEIARLCVLCPMTSQVKGWGFEVAVPADLPVGGGVVLADQVKSMSWVEHGAAFGCKAPPEVVAQVMAKLKTLVAL